ncbi:MAG: hypothetical protein HC828_21865 [Blastochloris sp.]|nr:hypothetical protein [Blastochloris sp.]
MPTTTLPLTGRLAATDTEQAVADLRYTITQTTSSRGKLIRRPDTDKLENGETFTQAEIENGTIRYDLAPAGQSSDQTDTFRFTVSDGQPNGTTTEQTFTITITGRCSKPN